MSKKIKPLFGWNCRGLEVCKFLSCETNNLSVYRKFCSFLNVFSYKLPNGAMIKEQNNINCHPELNFNNFTLASFNTSKFPAFTLAEVLITIAVIGVIAAITIPVVMPVIQERVDSHRHSNIVYKVTQATNLMKSLGMLGKFSNTDEFVDVLEKYLKISKRCDSEHLVDCWPTEKVIGSDGNEYNVKDAKTRGDLGFKNDKSNPNVGIVLTDGAAIIITYSADNEGLDPTDATIASAKELPVGTGTKEFLEFTTNSTAGLAFVVDVNGAKKPNSETINERIHDIRNLNGATFSKKCGGIEIGDTCYTPIDSYSALDCSKKGVVNNDYSTGTLNKPENATYCGSASFYANDMWAGAKKACENIGAQLPDKSQLISICKSHKNSLNITSDYYWSSSVSNHTGAHNVYFASCTSPYPYSRLSSHKVLCVKS